MRDLNYGAEVPKITWRDAPPSSLTARGCVYSMEIFTANPSYLAHASVLS